MKNGIGASLPDPEFAEFVRRADAFPGGKSGLIKEALREYFEAHPVSSGGNS